MNKNYVKMSFAWGKIFAAIVIVVLFIGNSYTVAGRAVSKSLYKVAEQQQTMISIRGKVIEVNGEPIIGASIIEKGTTKGVITDLNGNFTLKLNKNAVLIISYIGYKTQEVKATADMRVVLKESSEALNEVVVVGYGTQKKENLTGSVASVDVSKVLEARPQSDVSKALQGTVPGLSVISSSGSLDAEPTLTIRGVGTLSNKAVSDPLIVVDGVPMDDISYLNTQDIQSISVLKDAASSSIYGTRAAFGVILITTKSAKKTEKTTIKYTNNFAWATPTILPDYPDVPTQIEAASLANKRAGAQNELFGMDLDYLLPLAEQWRTNHNGKKAGYREMKLGDDFVLDDNGVGSYYADWDVVGIMYRNWKPAQSHNLSVQGTSGKTSYFMSMGYNHDEGVMTFNPNKLDKYNATMNLSTEVNDWLTVGSRFSFSDKKYTKPNSRRTTYQYMWRWGSFFGPYGTYQGEDFRNDIAYRKQGGDSKSIDTYTRMGAFMKANIVKGLTVNSDYTYNIRRYDLHESNIPVVCWNSWGGALTNGLSTASSYTNVEQTARRDKSYAFNLYANYLLDLNEDNHFNIMVGGNAEEGDDYSQFSERDDLLDPSKAEFNLATGDQYASGWHTQWGTCGYFGRINYNYQGKYLLELNGRYDGSSKFPSNNRWAFFPSASAGYRISEENFFEPIKNIFNNAKIRVSYGEIGNQAVGSNMYIETMSKATHTYWLDSGGTNLVSYDMPNLVSSTLKWERLQTLNLGLDLGLLDNELNVTADWYQRTTKDMLAPGKTMPSVLGDSSPNINAGTLRTRGWELNIDWNHKFNGISVYANGNICDYKTEITKWDNDSKLLDSKYSGKHYGDIWGFETDRYFTSEDFNIDGTYQNGVASQVGLQSGTFVYGPGDIKFKDLDNSGTIDGGAGTADNHGDLKVIGNITPRYQYSFRLGGNWKGFDLDCYFQGVGKRDVWTQSSFVMPYMRGVDALYANETNYWTEENHDQNADFPRLFGGGAGQGTISVLDQGKYNFYPQSKYLVHMAYLRFKDLTVGYTIPKELTEKAYLSKVRIYFSANNICEIINRSDAPVDPEINDVEPGVKLANATWGRIDPMYRTISFGAQLTF